MKSRGSSFNTHTCIPYSAIFCLLLYATCTNATNVCGSISTNTTWTTAGSPYIITCNVGVSGASNPILTIQSGVTVRFNNDTALSIGTPSNGRLTAIGAAASPIIFEKNTGAAFYIGIQLYNFNTTTIAFAEIKNATNGIRMTGQSPLIHHVKFEGNTSYAIKKENTATPSLYANTFISNTNNITSNNAISSPHCWWNSVSGPPPQSLSSNVTYEPWLIAVPASAHYFTTSSISNRIFNASIGTSSSLTFGTASSGNWTVTITNSASQTVRTFTGTGTSGNVIWDGKNQSGVMQPDGVYDYKLESTAGSNVATPSVGKMILDSTIPTGEITSPTENQILSNVYQSGSSNVPVIGSANDANLNNWKLEYGSGSAPSSWIQIATGTTPVINNTLATWSTGSLANGTYTLRLQVWDQVNLKKEVLRHVTVGNFSVSQNVLQLNAPANGTVTYTSIVPFPLTETVVIKNQSGAVVRTLVNASRNAGTFNDIWNGKNDQAQFIPDGPYFYVATATAGGSSITWDLTGDYLNNYSSWPEPPPISAYDPFTNLPMILGYNFSQAGRVTVKYGPNPFPATCDPPAFCFVQEKYEESGPHTVAWAGVDNSGALRADLVRVAVFLNRINFSKNAVVVYGTKPVISNFAVNPPFYGPANGLQQISFQLTTNSGQPVNGTITFFNQSSLTTLRTITLNGQSPGTVSLQWNGLSDSGNRVTQGLYTVTVTVTDTIGNTVSQRILTTVYF